MSCVDTKLVSSTLSDCDKDSIVDKSEQHTINGSVENLNKFETKFNNHRNDIEEEQNIIPWRAQLRKTNSRLSLIG